MPGPLRHRARRGGRRAADRARRRRADRRRRAERRPRRDPRRSGGDERRPERPLRARRGALPRVPPRARRRDRARGHRRDAEGLRPARHGRRRLPDRPEVGDRRRAGGDAEVRRLQRRRVRARHVQGPPDPRRAAAPRARGDAARHARDRLPRRAGSSSATSTAPRRRCCARRSSRCASRACSARTSSAPGGAFTIEIFTSPGGYILGEESALLECMEGHRGEPRNKPPFPGIYGLWGKPTLMNSVETFADVPVIVERGADWWKEQGINGAHRPEVLRRVGPREHPAVYCVPMAGSTDARPGRARGRRDRGPRGRRLPAGRRVVELPRRRARSTSRSTRSRCRRRARCSAPAR